MRAWIVDIKGVKKNCEKTRFWNTSINLQFASELENVFPDLFWKLKKSNATSTIIP